MHSLPRIGEGFVTTRLGVNINDETAAALNDLAARRQVTVTETVRRAVSVYKFIEDQVRDGKELRIVGPGEITHVELT